MTDSTTPAPTGPRPGWTRRRIGIVIAVAVIVVGGTVGGLVATSGSTRKVSAAASPTPTPTPTPTRPRPTPRPAPAVRPKPVPAVNPFTGIGGIPAGPVVAVKIDDTENGRPQENIDKADVVYVEQAEGGLTRLLAVFDTTKPTVEPVRSTRASDPELLEQYGPIAFVASGGGGDSLTILDASPLHSSINDRGAAGFSRDGNRAAPYNLQADLSVVAAAQPAAARARGIGWTFSTAAASRALLAASPSGQQIATTVGGTGVNFSYDNATGRYRRVIDGTPQSAADGQPISTPNVIVQFCDVTVHPGDVDVDGNPSQYTHSIGSGRVVVFRNGRELAGTWKRPNAVTGTSLLGRNGAPIPLAPGGAWVILVATGAPLTAS